jgi:hypothetical protein
MYIKREVPPVNNVAVHILKTTTVTNRQAVDVVRAIRETAGPLTINLDWFEKLADTLSKMED